MNSRKQYLDMIRIIACFMVITHHTINNIFLYTVPGKTWFVAMNGFLMTRPAIALFLMVSGVTLLKKEVPYRKTWNRFLRIIVVLLVFSLLYYGHYCLVTGTTFSIPEFAEILVTRYATSSIWYLYLYAAVILMSPILQKMVKSMEQADFKYYLWIAVAVCGMIPYVQHFFPDVQMFEDFQLIVFTGYVALVIAGYYLDRYVKVNKKTFWLSMCVYFACTLWNDLLTGWEFVQGNEDYLFLNDTQAITMILPAGCIFLMVKYLLDERAAEREDAVAKEKGLASRVMEQLAACSFGIYLFSDLFIARLAPLHDGLIGIMHPLPAVFLYQIVIFAVGFVLTFVLRKIPYVNRYI